MSRSTSSSNAVGGYRRISLKMVVAPVMAGVAGFVVLLLPAANSSCGSHAGRTVVGPVAFDLRTVAAQAEVIEVPIHVAGVIGMAAFDVTIIFDTAVVSPTGVVAGDFLPAGSVLLPLVADESGSVLVGSYNDGGSVSTGDGLLATITFRRLADRSPRLRLDREASGLYDATGQPLGPPARLFIGGQATPVLYLPWGRR